MAERLKSKTPKAAGINPTVLQALISKCETIKTKMDGQRGELGAAVKNAEDAHGVHRKAFKLALTVKNMDESARADFLRAFDDYRDKLGFNDQGDMFADDKTGEKGDPDAAAVAKNTEALKGVKQLEPAVH